ncbi:MFS transporter [Gordonia sp. TBRC 11910]|uniref:MFS transporter n=1 Tax=Gordonia asplenii TaxID=2725283 RepID=A0A848KXC1_9ACTN|nr:MFS transporter [Gordonia asplenii]NMO03290.1 MFS transporter [Gordonia asplenii]
MRTGPTVGSPTRHLGPALVTVAFLGAVIGGVGAPLITSVALDLHIRLDAAQWTLTATLFAGAVSAPVLGRLGSGSHRRSTVLVTLALVALGGLLTAIPLPFGVLLFGRALQGLGLGVIALLMSIARDYLPTERAQSVIATISVAGTVGIGVAYPLMGLLDQVAGLRVAYSVGFLLSLTAVAIAWRTVPADTPRPTPRLDVPGALLLGLGILGILLAVAQPAVWQTPYLGISVVVLTAATLTFWVIVERRATAPLVDLRLFMRGGVLRANAAMLTAGAGMYLLFSLLTRYVQTPVDAGYGFGLSGVVAGAALIPFSVLGFVGGRLTPQLAARTTAQATFTVYAGFVIVAATVFAIAPVSLAATLAAMAVLGFGVGGASAIMPRLVLDAVPRAETASVLAINQIVRTVGFSIGSALAGQLLAAATPTAAIFPGQHGYTIAAWCVLPLLALSAAIILTGTSISESVP